MAQTLEQQRAADAWRKAEGVNSDYVRLAKSAPALIMNSGLMQVLAFLDEKSGKKKETPHQKLGQHLRDWLHQRFASDLPDQNFKPFMARLMATDPLVFQAITAEALAWLRWMRQIAPACALVDDRRHL